MKKVMISAVLFLVFTAEAQNPPVDMGPKDTMIHKPIKVVASVTLDKTDCLIMGEYGCEASLPSNKKLKIMCDADRHNLIYLMEDARGNTTAMSVIHDENCK